MIASKGTTTIAADRLKGVLVSVVCRFQPLLSVAGTRTSFVKESDDIKRFTKCGSISQKAKCRADGSG
jgi:hypothetical protein